MVGGRTGLSPKPGPTPTPGRSHRWGRQERWVSRVSLMPGVWGHRVPEPWGPLESDAASCALGRGWPEQPPLPGQGGQVLRPLLGKGQHSVPTMLLGGPQSQPADSVWNPGGMNIKFRNLPEDGEGRGGGAAPPDAHRGQRWKWYQGDSLEPPGTAATGHLWSWCPKSIKCSHHFV